VKLEWKLIFRVGVGLFVLYLCILYWPKAGNLFMALLNGATPLFIGCVIAYILNILTCFYERHYFVSSRSPIVCKSRRPACMLAAFATLILIVALIIMLVVPQLLSCVQLIMAELPDAVSILIAQFNRLDLLPEDFFSNLSVTDWETKIGQAIQLLTAGIGGVMNTVIGALSALFSGVITVFISVIFAIYLLLGKEKLAGQCTRLMKHYLKKNWYSSIMHVLTITNNSFKRYIVGQCTEAVILGLLCIAGMFILRLPYAHMIGTLIGFTALIPVAGAYIGAGVGAFMILMESPLQAVIFLIFIVILQQLEGNLIYPKVVGSSIGLPAIWVFAAVTLGGGVMGILGMLLAVPLTSVIYQLLRENLNKETVTEDTTEEKEESGPV